MLLEAAEGGIGGGLAGLQRPGYRCFCDHISHVFMEEYLQTYRIVERGDLRELLLILLLGVGFRYFFRGAGEELLRVSLEAILHDDPEEVSDHEDSKLD